MIRQAYTAGVSLPNKHTFFCRELDTHWMNGACRNKLVSMTMNERPRSSYVIWGTLGLATESLIHR